MAKLADLQILSLNVRGIGDAKKRREIFRWLKQYHDGTNSIILLQETHSSDKVEQLWCDDWGSKIFFSHGTSNARGVAILMPLKYNFDTSEVYKDNAGRILSISVTIDDKSYNIVNVYAPTKDNVQSQVAFLKELDINLHLAESSYIIGGDFNTYLNPILDKEGGTIEKQSKYNVHLTNLMEEYNIIDIWRTQNPARKVFTWRQNKPRVQSRLDYFLISGELYYNITKVNIKPSIKTDHSLLHINLNILNEEKRGPGFWKFNTALLRDDVYIDLIKETILLLQEQYNTVTNHGLQWVLIKSDIRQLTIDYSKTRAKIRREVEGDLQKQYIQASDNFVENSSEENLVIMENIKENIEAINAFKTAGLQIRAKAQFIEENKKSTSYFLNVEKRNYKMKHIKKLNITETESIVDPSKILAEEKSFYKTLYTKNKNLNTDEYGTFFNNIPKLCSYDKTLCEQPLTIEECAKALLTLKNGKSPGSDGFPPDFYKIFWKTIKHIVFDSIIYGIENKELSIEQCRGVLKLILKKNKNPCYLKNWRPISLLNTDYKLIAQVFSKRLQKVLPTIISEFQNGYIQGRYIGYNIRTIIDIINFSKTGHKDCLIAFLDFEKAFDQLDWNFIEQTLTAFNFGPFFKNVVKTMYANVTSCVTNNGYSSEFFNIQRGIRQGCPLSALLFILAVEILSIKIRGQPSIKGITINTQEIKLTQLADDTTLFL